MHIIISEKKKKKRLYVMTTFKFQTKEKRKDTYYRERLLIPFALTSLYINKNMYSQFIKY